MLSVTGCLHYCLRDESYHSHHLSLAISVTIVVTFQVTDQMDCIPALCLFDRAHQRCCHMGQWGNFPSMALGGERGLRCYMTGGEQVR